MVQKVRLFVVCFWIFCKSLNAQTFDKNQVNFENADSVAKIYKGADLNSLPILVHQLTASLPTKVEKFRAIYTWICTNINNDYVYFLKNKKKQKQLVKDKLALEAWNDLFKEKVYARLRKQKKTVCTGYAYLLMEMAKLADIPCRIINGYGRSPGDIDLNRKIPNHSWNAVQLKGKWFLCDPTWSSGYIKENRFVRDYHEAYFLANPELFVKNHYPLDTSWILLDEKPSWDAFSQGPVIYKNTFTYEIIPLSPNTLEVSLVMGEAFTFLWKAPKSLNTQDLDLVYGVWSIKPKMRYTPTDVWEITCDFQIPGNYDIHFKMEGEYLFSYTIQVKKAKK